VSKLRLVWNDARGERHAVDVGKPMRVGRAPECELWLDEEGVSRVHCEVKPAAGGETLELADLRSTNGTYVNGTRVTEARVGDGDTVVLGRLLLRVERGGPGVAAEAYKTCYVGSEDVELAIDAATTSYPPAGLSPESSARHLNALYGILRAIGDAPNAAEMLRASLRTILDTLPLDFGHVLVAPAPRQGRELRELDVAQLQVVASHAKEGEPPPPSRTVARRVLTSGQAVLANDVQAEPELRSAKSVVAAKSLRIACAPIPMRGRVGVLQVAARGLASPVNADDVAFLVAAARQVGLAADALSEREHLARENELLRQSAPVRRLVGASAVMQRLRELVTKAAQVEATVLVTGESGTGKELVARGVHEGSTRASGPFVALNCGALPGDVVPSELFGHEKGAFTGAAARRVGLVELAHGGTLFLDEVGELKPDVQVMLLRLLEEKRFFRIGGQEEVRVDVRFVAATNRDLAAAASQGTFRKDLLFRLQVVEIRTPPLRDHLDDLDEIAQLVLDELARSTARPRKTLSAGARERMRLHAWPGNVRELRNALERAFLLGRGPVIEADELGLAPSTSAGGASSAAGGSLPRLVPLDQVERDHVRHVLAAVGWNKTKAAEILGVARITLYEKIRLYGLEPDA
jgi:DNA-binding NtrC family response regulator